MDKAQFILDVFYVLKSKAFPYREIIDWDYFDLIEKEVEEIKSNYEIFKRKTDFMTADNEAKKIFLNKIINENG